MRHLVVVRIDEIELAVLRPPGYARGRCPDEIHRFGEIHALRFVIDAQHARRPAERWRTVQRGDMLETRECPDRRLRRAAPELTARPVTHARPVSNGRTEVIVVLPGRAYPEVAGQLPYDRAADEVSQAPRGAATIIPFDVPAAVRRLASTPVTERRPALPEAQPQEPAGRAVPSTPIGRLRWRHRATVEGRVTSTRVKPIINSQILECEVADDTGAFMLLFYGRTEVPGVQPGQRIRVSGLVGARHGTLSISNPRYELLADEAGDAGA